MKNLLKLYLLTLVLCTLLNCGDSNGQKKIQLDSNQIENITLKKIIVQSDSVILNKKQTEQFVGQWNTSKLKGAYKMIGEYWVTVQFKNDSIMRFKKNGALITNGALAYSLSDTLLFDKIWNSKYPQNKSFYHKSNSLFDSIKSISRPNRVIDFDLEKLQTDDFSQMTVIDKKLFYKIYPNRNDYKENSFFIHSYISTNNNYLSLIIYQKNYEGENQRVDSIELITLDSAEKQINKVKLASKDNNVITYEVTSRLQSDSLKIIKKISSEPYFKTNRDTLYTTKYFYKLNETQGIDTIKIIQDFELRNY